MSSMLISSSGKVVPETLSVTDERSNVVDVVDFFCLWLRSFELAELRSVEDVVDSFTIHPLGK